MLWASIALLAIFLVEAQTYQPIKVFEIRKTRDHDRSIDYQYYDPDFSRVQSVIHREKDNKKLKRLADDIVKRLQVLSQHKEDYDDTDSDSRFVDETRSVIVLPSKDDVYHTEPGKEIILKKLIQAALRNGFDGNILFFPGT
ncbi:jg23275 [Pararge aegeria aegeria]|uniref:Jg23275 protein n=1 Tax=Pararge aegeria aegeria TaxID=348720 RepID=A0A8S4RIQ8_9NEOP|nr:jg23275 [Pararge aegeria aegeria]